MPDVTYVCTPQLAAGCTAVPGAGLTSCIKGVGISATFVNNGYGYERAAENCGPKSIATAKCARRSRSDTFSE